MLTTLFEESRTTTKLSPPARGMGRVIASFKQSMADLHGEIQHVEEKLREAEISGFRVNDCIRWNGQRFIAFVDGECLLLQDAPQEVLLTIGDDLSKIPTRRLPRSRRGILRP